jgi:hypothetical protein
MLMSNSWRSRSTLMDWFLPWLAVASVKAARGDAQRIAEGARRKTPASGWLDQVKVLGGVPPLPVKMRLNLESSRGEMI